MKIRKTLAALLRNRISLLGSAVVLVTAILLVTLVAIEMFGAEGHPYIGLLTYMILPGFLFLGLVWLWKSGGLEWGPEPRKVKEAPEVKR